VLSQESKKPKDAGTLFKEMYEVMHGENPELDNIPTIEWYLYLIFSLMTNVVALNLLVSVIGETFGNVIS